MKHNVNRIVKILERFKVRYGTVPWNWHTRQKPFYVLIATIMSQRTKDTQTDGASKRLFEQFPTPESLASAPVEKIEELIKRVNYFKTKARRIKEVSQIIVDKYGGRVPEDFRELISLPGVGRKTANCVLLYGFHKPVLPVDTHVHRISNRIGWIKTKTPEETEKALIRLVPEEWIPFINDFMVKHGQTICKPVNPLCDQCFINDLCDYKKQGSSKPI